MVAEPLGCIPLSKGMEDEKVHILEVALLYETPVCLNLQGVDTEEGR